VFQCRGLLRLSIIGTDTSGDTTPTLRVGVVVPTLNAGPSWSAWVSALAKQSYSIDRILVADSQSDDRTVEIAKQAGFEVLEVARQDFDHGGTRQLAVDHLENSVDVVVLLTQDAELKDSEAISALVDVFSDPTVGCAYGQQLARPSHSSIARHHRHFNYPNTQSVETANSLRERGLRAAFCSNSFAAYRVNALRESGGFPKNTIFGEDMFAALAIMQAGWAKCYVPTAKVWHAHDYTLIQDLRRYFDMGVMHVSEPFEWILTAYNPEL